jgi:hypothetical protein
MATDNDRLTFKIFRLIEGEAQGRFAVSALVIVALATLAVLLILRGAVS